MAAIKGLKQLEKRLERMSRPSKSEIRQELQAGADRVANLQRNLAPVDEGDLKDSIRTEQGRHELAIDVKAGGPLTTRAVRRGLEPDYDYAAKIEFQQPFFYPAYRALKKSITRKISQAIRRAATLDAQ